MTGYLYLGGLLLIVGGAVVLVVVLADWIREKRHKRTPAPAAQPAAVQPPYVNACDHGISMLAFCDYCCSPDAELSAIEAAFVADIETYLAGGESR
jgi:hypothetical protein